MANPNYSPKPTERKDTYPQFAKEKELESEWFHVDRELYVPSDTYLYLAEKDPRAAQPRYDEVVFQFHRWVETYRKNPKVTEETPVGEWVIVPRGTVRRGEYIKGNFQCELPVKHLNMQKFLVDKAALPFGDETILVDFEGGRTLYTRDAVKAEKEGDKPRVVTLVDEAATEVLMMQPDGRVSARNSATDAADPQRQTRHTAFTDRLIKVKKEATGGGGPFGG
jgi:hypothetical protein